MGKNTIYFTSKEVSEIDHYSDAAGENGYDWDSDGRYEVIGDKASTHGGMVSINKMREYLSEMEKIGSNYVRIGFHSDHNELEIVGVSYTKSTQEEIDAYLEKEIKVKEARKQARIAELQAEMDRIKSL
jgi:hypothetical protein